VHFHSVLEWVVLGGKETQGNKKKYCVFLNTGRVIVVRICTKWNLLSVSDVEFCMGRLHACIYDN
jgi:hypothetical protein